MLLLAQHRIERQRIAPRTSQPLEAVGRCGAGVAEQGLEPELEKIPPRRAVVAGRGDLAAPLVPHDRQANAQRGEALELSHLAQQVGGAQRGALPVAQVAEPPLDRRAAQRTLGGRETRRGLAGALHDGHGCRLESLIGKKGAVADRQCDLVRTVGIEGRDLSHPADAEIGHADRAIDPAPRPGVGEAGGRRADPADLRLGQWALMPGKRGWNAEATQCREKPGQHRRHVTPGAVGRSMAERPCRFPAAECRSVMAPATVSVAPHCVVCSACASLGLPPRIKREAWEGASPMAVQELRHSTRDTGVRLRRGGGGAPLLFLHGAGGWPAWGAFFDRLAQGHEVIVPEHPGFGVSDNPPALRNVGDLAMYYLDFLDALGGPPVHLVGHSLGGWIAAEIVVRNASRLKSLTLIAPAGVRVKGMICGDNFIWSREEYA